MIVPNADVVLAGILPLRPEVSYPAWSEKQAYSALACPSPAIENPLPTDFEVAQVVAAAIQHHNLQRVLDDNHPLSGASVSGQAPSTAASDGSFASNDRPQPFAQAASLATSWHSGPLRTDSRRIPSRSAPYPVSSSRPCGFDSAKRIHANPEHIALIDKLTRTLRPRHVLHVSRLLYRMEHQGDSWPQLVHSAGAPGADPHFLELKIGQIIRDYDLEHGTWTALNLAFELKLQGESGRHTLMRPEHIELMDKLRRKRLSPLYVGYIRHLLYALEQQDSSWPQLIRSANPQLIELKIGQIIRNARLYPAGTLVALNKAFGLELQGESVRRKLTQPEHIALMNKLRRDGLSSTYVRYIRCLLYELEQQGDSWPQWASAGAPDANPQLLEQAVNKIMDDARLWPGTLTALNQAFGLKLQGKSGRRTLTRPEHIALMDGLASAQTLTPTYRSHIKSLLVHLEWQGLYHLERQGDSEPQLRLSDSDSSQPLPSLEEVVNQTVQAHNLSVTTRSALNMAFKLKLNPQ